MIMQRCSVVQHELLPELRNEVGPLTPKLERGIHTLEWLRIEEFVSASWCGTGHPPHEHSWLANAFVERLRKEGKPDRLCLSGSSETWRPAPVIATIAGLG